MTTFAERLDLVEQRFVALAQRLDTGGLTGADLRTGERWDAGQVWAHTAEFPHYWLGEVATVVRGWAGAPVPFGRVKSDPDRLAAIERDRTAGTPMLAARVLDGIAAVRARLAALSPDDWRARGVHSTLGEMDLERIVDEFLVGHLEEHAAQLESLA
jgi:hypothetical protein